MRTLVVCSMIALAACAPQPPPPPATTAADAPAGRTLGEYFDPTGREDLLGGGVRMIPVSTPQGEFRVWTKRVGNNPRLQVLLLHGGPGATHEYLEAFDSYLPGAGVEYYHYDQLGSAFSDQPDEPELWRIPRFVDEVEQVRAALGLGPESFVLYGHSWGGILAIEYALAHQEKLAGLVISNMMSSIPAYNRYAHEVLMPAMDQDGLAAILALEERRAYDDPRYEELLIEHYYVDHVLRLPLAEWPPGVLRGFGSINKKIYIPLQGPSEMGASGLLERWDRSADLAGITVPTLVIGGAHDTMDPKHMEWMAGQIPNGRYLHCPEGSHLAMYDDQATYMEGLIAFLEEVEAGEAAGVTPPAPAGS
jgi:proline iminopeptidase